MTDEDQKQPLAGAEGAKLRAARESAEREIAELATQLHLDVNLLEAIEADDFAKLGAPVFARGHLRKYAEALGVDSQAAVAQYEALQDPNELPPVVAPINNRKLGTKIPGWVIGLALGVAILAALLLGFLGRTEGSQDAVPVSSAQLSVPEAAPAQTNFIPDEIERRIVETPTAPPPSAEMASEVEAVTPPPAAPRTRDALIIEVSAECWIEVRDSNARRLFGGTAAAGRVLRFNGRAPFSLVIGNRRAVEIRQNDETVSIPADAIRGRTARFNTPPSQIG